MSPSSDSKDGPGSTYYDANYGNFQTELYTEIRREAFGEDIGQNSWLTAREKWRRHSSGSVAAKRCA